MIKPGALAEQSSRAAYKADGKLREIDRDVAKRWMDEQIRIACVGFENQTTIDKDMPLRVIGYDGAEYRAAVKKKGGERYPVVTLILYFGFDKPWDTPKTLFECLTIPDRLKPYVNDYRINVVNVAYLEDEVIKKFTSDFRTVAEYMGMKRKGEDDYSRMTKNFDHAEETLQLLRVMTGDYRFEEVYNDRVKGEARNMCELLDRIENRGREAGREEGRIEGREEGRGMIRVLMKTLYEIGRDEDAKRVAWDDAYCEKLLEEFNIIAS